MAFTRGFPLVVELIVKALKSAVGDSLARAVELTLVPW